jgi:hypothetical protein
MPRAVYPSIADDLKATSILEGSHFTEDSRMVYTAVASSMLNTPVYAHFRHFEKERNGCEAMLTLKVQFGGTAFNVSWSNTVHDFLEKATFSGPKRGYTYLEHVAKFNEAMNEREPLPEHVKVRKFCMSLKETFLGEHSTTIMTSPDMSVICCGYCSLVNNPICGYQEASSWRQPALHRGTQ